MQEGCGSAGTHLKPTPRLLVPRTRCPARSDQTPRKEQPLPPRLPGRSSLGMAARMPVRLPTTSSGVLRARGLGSQLRGSGGLSAAAPVSLPQLRVRTRVVAAISSGGAETGEWGSSQTTSSDAQSPVQSRNGLLTSRFFSELVNIDRQIELKGEELLQKARGRRASHLGHRIMLCLGRSGLHEQAPDCPPPVHLPFPRPQVYGPEGVPGHICFPSCHISETLCVILQDSFAEVPSMLRGLIAPRSHRMEPAQAPRASHQVPAFSVQASVGERGPLVLFSAPEDRSLLCAGETSPGDEVAHRRGPAPHERRPHTSQMQVHLQRHGPDDRLVLPDPARRDLRHHPCTLLRTARPLQDQRGGDR